jgi:protein transport protein SEC31
LTLCATLSHLSPPFFSNPYATSSRPGTAQVSAAAKAPVSTDYDPSKILDLQPEYQPIKDCLMSLTEALKNLGLLGGDKRLLGEGEKAVAVMLKRLARGEISDEIGQQVLHMCGYINAYDFRSAQNVQTALVNSDWRDHKDWLKGTKALLQLSTKKFAQ